MYGAGVDEAGRSRLEARVRFVSAAGSAMAKVHSKGGEMVTRIGARSADFLLLLSRREEGGDEVK